MRYYIIELAIRRGNTDVFDTLVVYSGKNPQEYLDLKESLKQGFIKSRQFVESKIVENTQGCRKSVIEIRL